MPNTKRCRKNTCIRLGIWNKEVTAKPSFFTLVDGILPLCALTAPSAESLSLYKQQGIL